MKITIYYAALLVLIVLIAGFLIQGDADSMSMGQMVSVSVLLGIYVVAISAVGEGRVEDEREMQHRYWSNRLAMVAGTAVLSLGVLVQLFSHDLDPWLLAGLVAVNLVKIIGLIYSSYRH